MERFWRTLREGCLDYVDVRSSLHEVQLKLLAFVDRHYHHRAHASLLGKSPAKVWATRAGEAIGEDELERALTVRATRKVRADGTVSIGGQDWELEDSWLASHTLTIGRSFADPQRPPWVEHEDERLKLRLVDPVSNSRRRRPPTKRKQTGVDAVAFDPNRVRVDALLGRRPTGAR